MFFQRKNVLKQKNKYSSLSSKMILTSSKYDDPSFRERISLSASTRIQVKGAIVAEAAIAIPVFIMTCISLLFMIEVIRMQNTIQGALLNAGKSVSEVLCFAGIDEDTSADIKVPLVAKNLSVFTIQEMVRAKITPKKLDGSCIIGGSRGLSFLHSNIKEDWIDIIVQYRVKPHFSFIPLPGFQVVQRCRIRGWTGAKGVGETESDEIIVYKTPKGSVYHKNKNCTHLKLSIKNVPFVQLSSLRNSNGAKYYPCKKCIEEADILAVYITEDGTSYHSTLRCSELKRTVIALPMSEVKNLRCCSRCGG